MLNNSDVNSLEYKAHTNMAISMALLTAWNGGGVLSYIFFKDNFYVLVPLLIIFVLLFFYLKKIFPLTIQVINISEDELELSYPDGFCLTRKNYVSLKIPYSSIDNTEYLGGINGALTILTKDAEHRFYHYTDGAKIVEILKEQIAIKKRDTSKTISLSPANYESNDVNKEAVELSIKRLIFLFFSILLLFAIFTQI